MDRDVKNIDIATLRIKLNPDGSCSECEEGCPQGLLCNCECYRKRTGNVNGK